MENWIRNEVPEDIPENDLEFQIISSHAHDVFNEETDESEFTIHLFGCDSHGNSVGATILGFCPYFYVEIPEILAPIWTIKHNKLFEGWLNLRLRDIGYGIKGAVFHDCRRNALTNFMKDKGLNVPETMKIAGHTDPRMLLRIYNNLEAHHVAKKLNG